LSRIELTDSRIIIPVRNGGERWRQAALALARYVPDASMVVVVDSDSSDGSDRVALEQGFELLRIDAKTFNHGRTRQDAVARFCQGKAFVIFLTQDAVIAARETLPNILAAFEDPRVGVAYGRQLPHVNARPFEAHAALFNYPVTGDIRSVADASRLGIKTAFNSNSFSAYRICALEQCGGFPSHLVLGEDAWVAMRMLLAGWYVKYCADAPVYHSHDYSLLREMERYFDFGVMHAQMPELLSRFGIPEGEGLRFVKSEFRHIWRTAPWLLPEVVVRNGLKYVGYRLGRNYLHLPNAMRRRLSMTKGYWSPPGGA
jgi:rhamnosyltransferase